MSKRLVLSDHARNEAARRGIDVVIVRRVAETAEQVLPIREGREVRQSRVPFPPNGRVYLVRVFVDAAPGEDRVVTVYRTSKVDKYWRIS